MTANPPTPAAPLSGLLDALRGLIQQGRQQALRAVDMVQVQTCWEVGRHIVEFEQGGEARAAYGKRLLPELAQALTREFGRGFDASNLRYMRLFYNAFPIRDALRHELSWTHYRLLLRVSSAEARQWYVTEAATQNWSSRALERQIGTLYYERLVLSGDKASVTAEATANLAALPPTPRAFMRDPVMLEFLGLPGTGKAARIQTGAGADGQIAGVLAGAGQGLCFRGPPTAHQHRVTRLLHRPGVLQLPAQVFCIDRLESR